MLKENKIIMALTKQIDSAKRAQQSKKMKTRNAKIGYHKINKENKGKPSRSIDTSHPRTSNISNRDSKTFENQK